MNKIINKHGGVILVFLMLFSMFVIPIKNELEKEINLPIENEYRLKFVDSVDYELGLTESIKIIYPVEILDFCEKDGYINIKTYENSIVYAPFDCFVVYASQNEVEIKLNKITCKIKNLICGVGEGTKISCGDIIGTVSNDLLLVQVFWGNRQLGLSEIEAMI